MSMTAQGYQDSMEETFPIGDYVAMLRRRWLLIVAPAVVGTVLAGFAALILPPTYVSSARILVESQQIRQDLAQTTVTTGSVERVRQIEQRLKTRQNMLDLAARHNVFADRPNMSPTQIVGAMQAATILQNEALAGGGRRGPVTSALINVSFRASSPAIVTRVTNDLVTQILEANIRERSSQAGETLAFFSDEAERLGGQLAQLEARLSTFQRENVDALPQTLEARRSELIQLRGRAFELESRRIALEEQKRALEQAIEIGVAGGPERPMTPQQRQLASLRQDLVQQSTLLSETHPRIRALKAQIATLEQTTGAASAGAAENAEAEYARRVELAATENLRQIELIDRNLGLIDNQMEVEQSRMRALEASILRTPEIEAELNTLLRQQQSIQSRYATALAKRAEAEIGERLEVNRQAERFELIEQPSTPNQPESPNRPLIVAAGFGGGLALGAALAVLLELLDKRIRTSRDLERALGLRPFGTIPYIATRRETSRRVLIRRMALFAIVVVIPLTLYAVDQFVLPLATVAERVYSATGLERLVELLQNRLAR